ncbi:FK506-binding protein [Paramicrosporidium saccamoebae]|uniref:peptidylprolyl isomerase n=1 Tax=Paramicrosporidium saccamoebae TaxID=1246581 RepID=A0A2H9TH75_9FUNG|nr:FK506-binding protein [Paramicrosporidium saccamoebae]
MLRKPIGFWGLVMEPGKMYSQEVPVSFWITMAALGPEAFEKTTEKPARSQVKLTHQKDGEFTLCTLRPDMALDLVFLEGETIHLRVVGENSVHLTGYYIDDVEDRDPYARFDSEELDAEMNGEDIEESDECCEHSEEDDEDEETEDEMADFIDDGSADESADEKVSRKTRTIREITSDEDSEMDDEYLSEEDYDTEDGTEEDIEDDGCNFSGSADEEIDSDEAGSVDMISKARKMASSEAPSKKSKVEKPSAKVQAVEKKKAVLPSPKPVNTTLQGGIKVEDIKVGAGIKAQKSRKVDISYTVTGEDNKPVESAGKTLTFNLGDSKVLKALSSGITGMALGGVRKLVVPSNMAQEGLQPALTKGSNYTITVTLNKVEPSFKAK